MLKTGEKVVAIIIARGGSKSIPRKNVLPLRGKPLVAWPITLAKSIPRVDRVILTTDDEEIAQVGREYGAEVPFKRPPELAEDQTPTVPVLQHCLKFLQEKENYHADIALLLYPTAPFLKKERVEEALDLFEKTGCNSVLSVIPDWGRFWRLDESTKKYQPFYPKERVNRQYYNSLYREDGAVYFSRYAVLVEMGKLVDDQSIEFLMMKEGENIDIDNPEDLDKARQEKIN